MVRVCRTWHEKQNTQPKQNMNNNQVAHLWANKSRQSARGSSFYFEGDTIYSYGAHFPIARHCNGAVLFTRRSYSVSTEKHKGLVLRACSHLPIFRVVDVKAKPSRADVAQWAADVENAKAALVRARDKEAALRRVEHAVTKGNAFCEHFGFKTRFTMPDETELAKLREQIAKDRARKAVETKRRAEAERAERAERLAKWLAGEGYTLPHDMPVYLRARGGNLETSKGASVLLAVAERTFRFIVSKRETGWHRNGETFAIGDFHLDAVNSAGIVAGCHRISWPEIERFAKLQGWL